MQSSFPAASPPPGKTLVAVTRAVSPCIAECELSHIERTDVDAERASVQHLRYERTLARLGCRVVALPAEPAMPDAVFVEDVALVLDEVAVMTRPGAESRRGEVASVAAVLAGFRPLLALSEPATLDGGDVLRLGRTLHVGRSGRSNEAGVRQLGELLAPFGYEVRTHALRGCLHLKSAVTQVADDTLLVQPAWVRSGEFAGYRLIEVDPAEPHAANALRIGACVVYPACFPRTVQRLRDAGIAVTTVDVTELQKAEGAVTCCSLVFEHRAPQVES